MTDRLLIVGLGYTGAAVAQAALAAGYAVRATSRNPAGRAMQGVEIVGFAPSAFAGATHVLMTAAPDAAGDPVLPAMAAAIGARWAGYLSTTGVYGDRAGGWVDETTPPAPGSARAQRRVAAEAEWAGLAPRMAVDIFRLAGIYGPGRSALDEVRAGAARRVVKPGHAFSRIHRDDIARAVLTAMPTPAPGLRLFNLADDVPAPSAEVIAAAAALLGTQLPPEVPFETASATMSPMARSFWAENRRVSAARTKAALGIAWRYPSYREGLAAILRDERADGRAE